VPIGLAASIIVAFKFKTWIKRFTTFHTWLGISLGRVAGGQISRSIIALAPYTLFNWLPVIGLGLFVVLIAMEFYFLDLFRSGAFVVEVKA